MAGLTAGSRRLAGRVVAVGALLALGLAVLTLLTPRTEQPGPAPAAPVAVTSTLQDPAAAGPAVCPGHEAPPPPAAVEEGTVPVAPVPVPAQPVGGPLLGSCGLVAADGSPPPPHVSASAWILADLDSGNVLAAQDAHGRYRPASTMKILTTLVVRQRLSPDAEVVGDPSDTQVDGSRAGIGPGGHYTVRQLLEGLLLNSGNDTAAALARTLGGTEATLAAMQETATRLRALDTRPATPSGLDGPGMSISAYDLAVLFREAMRDPMTAQILATPVVPFPGYGTQPGFVLSNDDPLLRGYPGALAGKTGYTDAARHTFVGAAERGGRRLVVVLLHGEQRPQPMWQQAAALLDHGFALPRDTPAVGQLVDPPKPAPASATEQPAAAAAPDTSAPLFTPWGIGLAVVAAVAAFAVVGVRLLKVLRS